MKRVLSARGQEWEGWRPTGTSPDGLWEWSHTVEELLVSVCIPKNCTEEKVAVSVTQSGPMVRVGLNLLRGSNAEDWELGGHFPAYLEVACEAGKAVCVKSSTWRIIQLAYLARAQEVVRSIPSHLDSAGSQGVKSCAKMVSIRFKKVSDTDSGALCADQEETVPPAQTTMKDMQAMFNELRNASIGVDPVNDLGGFWTFPKDTLDAPSLESQENSTDGSMSSDKGRDYADADTSAGLDSLSGTYSRWSRKMSGSEQQDDRRSTIQFPQRPVAEPLGTSSPPHRRSLHEHAGVPTKSRPSTIELGSIEAAMQSMKLPVKERAMEYSSESDAATYEPYTEAELVQYEMEGITRPDTGQTEGERKVTDVFFFEDDESGWHGVGYGSYASAAPSENEQRKLFEEIITQAESRSCGM